MPAPKVVQAALDFMHYPPLAVITESNWEAARAAQLLPDHVYSFKSFQDWLANLTKLTMEGIK